MVHITAFALDQSVDQGIDVKAFFQTALLATGFTESRRANLFGSS
jgi:hypothetical protein